MNNKFLDYFGEILMNQVRDETISTWDMLIEEKMKGITAEIVKEKMSSFNEEQVEIIKWLIPKIIDTNLHNLLVMFEQNDDIKIEICTEERNSNIKELSDGLEGELYTEDGWINRFSKERYDEI